MYNLEEYMCLFSFIAIGTHCMLTAEISANITTGMYRVLFSLPIFFLLSKYNKDEYKMTLSEKLIAVCAGAFLAMDLILWNISFSYTTVANANLLANLVPFTVVPVLYFIYKEKVSKAFLIGGGIILIGILVLMGGKVNPTAGNFKGDALAILTSIFYGLFIVTVYKLRSKVSTIYLMSYASIGCLIVLLPVSLLLEGIYVPYTFNDFYPLIGLALLSQILGQGGLSYCLGKIKASYASLLVLTQPIISAIYAYFIFNEHLSLKEIAGGGVVLIGLYIANKKK